MRSRAVLLILAAAAWGCGQGSEGSAPTGIDPGLVDPGRDDPGQKDAGEVYPGQLDPGQPDPGNQTPDPEPQRPDSDPGSPTPDPGSPTPDPGPADAGPPCADGAAPGETRCEGYHLYRCAGGQWTLEAEDTIECSPYKDKELLLLVDEETSASLESEIARYSDDVRSSLGVEVVVDQGRWESAEQVRSRILQQYEGGALLGSFLVGDVALGYVSSGGLHLLSDWLYQDMDGDLEERTREVFSARLLPAVPGEEGVERLRSYFDKNHRYRSGEPAFDEEILFYNAVGIREGELSEEQFFETFGDVGAHVGLPYPTKALYHPGAELCAHKSELLAEIAEPYRLSILHTHGSPTTQWLYDCSVHTSEVLAAPSNAFFVALVSCSNGRFDVQGFHAASYLFSGDTLLVEANSDDAMVIGGGAYPDFLRAYRPHAAGIIAGEAYRYEPVGYLPHLFGDPTLRVHLREEYPRVVFPAGATLDFGHVESSDRIILSLPVANTGHGPLHLEWWRQGCTTNAGVAVNCPFNYNTGQGMPPVDVPAGGSAELRFQIWPAIAHFSETQDHTPMAARVSFMTDDPWLPALSIELTATVSAEVEQEE